MAVSATSKKKKVMESDKIAELFGNIMSFNSSLKLYHWHVTGPGSYAKHMALDEAIGSILDVTDRLVETTYAYRGDIEINIPETKMPQDVIKHTEGFYNYIEDVREILPETFSQSIVDDYQEALHQLLYRLKRLQ